MAGFPCRRCGCCCRRVTMKPAGLEHLCGLDPAGTCIHYVEGEGCSIYETRPKNCRVEEVYFSHEEEFYKHMPLSTYLGVAKALCYELQSGRIK